MKIVNKLSLLLVACMIFDQAHAARPSANSQLRATSASSQPHTVAISQSSDMVGATNNLPQQEVSASQTGQDIDPILVKVAELEEKFSAAGAACSGISDQISKISGISKVNTAITGVSTVASGGALYAGIKKSAEDEEIERLEKLICERGGCDALSVSAMSDADFFNNILPLMAEIADLQRGLAKSKKLGNWRTGLLAGSTATNIGSAIIAGLNTNQSDLIQQITACNEVVRMLKNDLSELKTAGANPAENPIMNKISSAIQACEILNTSDVEKIETRMKVVLGTSITGAVVGAVGVGTSAAANSDNVRSDNTDDGKKKEKNFNTTANVMAGAGTVTGLVGTGFNISLIVLTHKLLKQAQRCEEGLE
ncbi:hypothetical protein FACS18945_3130 [Bacteroidia bacterium]|nr:hypothetical protein FACS18945_3130 [Bacteroidia bacterium]